MTLAFVTFGQNVIAAFFPKPYNYVMDEKRQTRDDDDPETRALAALDEARKLPHGPERTEALKQTGKLRNAADRHGISFAKTVRPRRS